MFGHDDNTSQQHDGAEPQADATLDAGTATATAVSSAPPIDASEVDEALKALDAAGPEDAAETAATPADTPASTPAVGADTEPAPVVVAEPASPVVDETPVSEPTAESTSAPTEDSTSQDDEEVSGALLDLKQSALEQLTPLVDQLDQNAEERFRTLMMMIQAADNQDLLRSAYDAAQQIEDEKVKAQALLDVVNEINYFTQAPAAEA